MQLAAKGSCNPTQPPPQRHPVGDSAFPQDPSASAAAGLGAFSGPARWAQMMMIFGVSISHRIHGNGLFIHQKLNGNLTNGPLSKLLELLDTQV